MFRALWNSRSGLAAQQNKLDSISNNIANVNTEGYKRQDVGFEDLVYETLERKGYPVHGERPKEPLTGTGVKTGEWIRDTSQGNLKETGIKTDMALDGEGYFRIIMQDGTQGYIRAGSFNIDTEGSIIDKNGNKLSIVDNNGREINAVNRNNPNKVVFSKNHFRVDKDGTVYSNLQGQDGLTPVGQIRVYDAVGDKALRSIGNNVYVLNNDSQIYQVNDTDIRQGFVELSNVQMDKEFTDMILTQRAFEFSSRALRTADEMWGMANNLRR